MTFFFFFTFLAVQCACSEILALLCYIFMGNMSVAFSD